MPGPEHGETCAFYDEFLRDLAKAMDQENLQVDLDTKLEEWLSRGCVMELRTYAIAGAIDIGGISPGGESLVLSLLKEAYQVAQR